MVFVGDADGLIKITFKYIESTNQLISSSEFSIM